MILWILTVIAYTDPPVPLSQWTVPFEPQNALLKSSGRSLLFNQAEVYLYDADGNLTQNFTLLFTPDQTFVGPDDSIWIHDGVARLGLLNDNNNLQWQKEIAPPSIPPFAFEGYLVYVSGNHIQMLDPNDGSVKFGNHHSNGISGLSKHSSGLLISDDQGSLTRWEPLSGAKTTLLQPSGDPLFFATPTPDGGWTLAYQSGVLEQRRADGSRVWRRDFRIGISTPPLWLNDGERDQLFVTTLARRLTAYSSKSIQLATTLIRDRPRAIVPWSDTLCVVIPGKLEQLFWYNAETRRFTTQQLDGRPILNRTNGQYVLLIDDDQKIRLFQRHIFTSSNP